MTSAELVSELRAAKPVAGDALRQHVRTIATAEPEPRPSFLVRLRLPRPVLVAVPVAAALALVAAGAIGFARSDGTQEAAPPVTAESAPGTDFAEERAQKAGEGDGTTEAAPASPTTGVGAATAPAQGGVTPATDRAQRYAASLTLEVDDIDALSEATQRALSITRSLGGHVVTVSYATAESGTASMTLRVPSDKAQDAVAQLSQLGTIRAQQVQIDDLQESIDSLDAEIVKLREQIARLATRLANPNLPDDTRSIVRARLETARAELASLQASRRATVGEAALATVHLSLQTPTESAAAPAPSRFDRALDEAVGVLAWEGIALLYAAIIAAPFVLAGLAAFLVRRGIRKRDDERLLASS